MEAALTELIPYRGIDWQKSEADRPGRCSYAGSPIATGDAIYTTTDHPALANWRVLVSEYEKYDKMKRVYAHFKNW